MDGIEAAVEAAGYTAGHLGLSHESDPYLIDDPLYGAWRRGYLRGQREAEIEEQEGAGHFRDR